MIALRRQPPAEPVLPDPGWLPPSPTDLASSSAERDPLAGTQYKTVRRLGSGGMGEVFEALHVALNKPVVVKLLHQAIASDPRYADRLRVEAQTLASIESPHLVSVSDLGCTADNRPFFVMERLSGATLGQVLDRRGRLPPAEAIQWAIQALSGLAAAHRRGIVHRDVKLDNLFLCNATPVQGPLVKVLDFGVAKLLHHAERSFFGPKYATEENSLVGSPRYVSPEQVRFEPVDARTDVYAVGVVLYNLLVGHGPFPNAKDELALLNAHLLEIPPPPSKVARQPLPPELDRAVLKAMAKRAEERFQSAELFAEELGRIANRLAETTLPLPPCDIEPTLACDTSADKDADRPGSARTSADQPPDPSLLPEQATAPEEQAAVAERRVFIAVALASTVLSSSLFWITLHVLGVL